MTKSQKRALRWLAKLESGAKTAEIAAQEGLAVRTIQEQVQRVKDWLQHSEQQTTLADPDSPLRVLMTGVFGRRCRHGRPKASDGEWLCADCMRTNAPWHWRLRKGQTIRDPGRYPAGAPWPLWRARMPNGLFQTLEARNRANAWNAVKRLIGLKSRDRIPENVTLEKVRG